MDSLTKQRYANSIRIYINHKRVLEKHSDWYKKEAIAKSMSKCYELFKMVKRDCSAYSFTQIAKMVLMYEGDLMMILPAPKNPSFERQKEKIERLIFTAREALK